MSEEKAQKHPAINILISAIAGLAVLAVIGFIIFKVGKSLSSPNVEVADNDSSNVEITHQEKVVQPTTNTPIAIHDSSKMAALFIKYFKKDSVPTKYPKFLSEAFIGYAFGDYLYLKRLDFFNIPETYETIEGNNREMILELGHYYKGIAALISNDAEHCIENLQWTIDHASNKELAVKAKWFLALAYIKMYEPKKAAGLLKEVAASNSVPYYKEQAKNLLKELNLN